jgi:hypothetical protein
MSTTSLFTIGDGLMCTVSMPAVAAAVTCALAQPSERVALAQTALTDVMYATDACDEPEEHVGVSSLMSLRSAIYDSDGQKGG